MQIASNCITCGNKDLIAHPAVLMPFLAHRIFNWQPPKKLIKIGNLILLIKEMHIIFVTPFYVKNVISSF